MNTSSTSPSRSVTQMSTRSSSSSLPSVFAKDLCRYDLYGARGGKSLSATKYPSPFDVKQKASASVPGPGRYNPERVRSTTKSGKFSDATPKSELDWMALRASQQPGPGDYEASMASLGKVATEPRSSRFGVGNPKTELDWIALRSKQLPGPGQYDYDMFDISRRTSQQAASKPPQVSLPDDGLETLKARLWKVKALGEALNQDPLLRSPYESNTQHQLGRLKRELLVKLSKPHRSARSAEAVTRFKPYLQRAGGSGRSSAGSGADPELRNIILALSQLSSSRSSCLSGEAPRHDRSTRRTQTSASAPQPGDVPLLDDIAGGYARARTSDASEEAALELREVRAGLQEALSSLQQAHPLLAHPGAHQALPALDEAAGADRDSATTDATEPESESLAGLGQQSDGDGVR